MKAEPMIAPSLLSADFARLAEAADSVAGADVLPKVRLARSHVRAGHLRLYIEVDGGIAPDTIEAAAEAGADVFVAGSAVFGADDPARAIEALRAQARGAMSV